MDVFKFVRTLKLEKHFALIQHAKPSETSHITRDDNQSGNLSVADMDLLLDLRQLDNATGISASSCNEDTGNELYLSSPSMVTQLSTSQALEAAREQEVDIGASTPTNFRPGSRFVPMTARDSVDVFNDLVINDLKNLEKCTSVKYKILSQHEKDYRMGWKQPCSDTPLPPLV